MLRSETESLTQVSILSRLKCAFTANAANVALETESRSLTFTELDRLSDNVAHALYAEGIDRGQLVAIFLDRSAELIISILAVLKTGAAYLPIDTSIPPERLHYMLEDAQVAAVISNGTFAPKLAGQHVLLIASLLQSSASVNLPPEADAHDLAYVIYTSGSTGRPKGVAVTRSALALSVDAIVRELKVVPEDVVLATTSPSFDASAMEIFTAMTGSARLVLFPQKGALSSELFCNWVQDSRATILFGTPTLWRLLLDSGWRGNQKMRGVIGGESLDIPLANRLLPKVQSLWNHYGPTEGTIVATTHRVQVNDNPIPIGRPLPHVRILIVDEQLEPVGKGEVGELLIGGEALAEGYRNRLDLTASRFPWIELKDGRRRRFYRTGDLVKEMPGGELLFAGRIDSQVKVRGYRIELEEVEQTMQEFNSIVRCAVVVNGSAEDDKRLVAYFESERPADTAELRGFLAKRLPGYMVPSHFVALTEFPVTTNGKVDRIALSARPIAHRAVSDVDTTDPLVRDLLAIWRRVLRLSDIRPSDNFFDLGGHSVLAAKLFTEIKTSLGKALPLATLFEAPTVEGLARLIERQNALPWSPLVPIQTYGSKSPFFCVHPIGGNVLAFRELSDQMPDRPFYGLQARGLDGKEQPHLSIEAMARDYLHYIRQVRPRGPYLLGGYSAGGLVAFEMARMLIDAGEQVELLVLLDTYLHPASLEGVFTGQRTAPQATIRNAVVRRAWQMRNASRERRLDVIGRDFVRVWSTLKLKAFTALDRRGVRFRLDAFSAFLLALSRYRPKPLALDTILFLADRNAPQSSSNLPAIWLTLVSSGLEIVHLDVDHDHLLEQSFAGQVATLVEQKLLSQQSAHRA